MEEILIPLIVFSFIAFVIKTIVEAAKEKTRLKYSGKQADNSLTQGELHRMIERAVAEATAPLLIRLEALEEEKLQLPAAERRLQLDERDGVEEEPIYAPSRSRIS